MEKTGRQAGEHGSSHKLLGTFTQKEQQVAAAEKKRSGHQVNTGLEKDNPDTPSSRRSHSQGGSMARKPTELAGRGQMGTTSMAVSFFLLWCFLLDFLP